jgi:hypothetical protein
VAPPTSSNNEPKTDPIPMTLNILYAPSCINFHDSHWVYVPGSPTCENQNASAYQVSKIQPVITDQPIAASKLNEHNQHPMRKTVFPIDFTFTIADCPFQSSCQKLDQGCYLLLARSKSIHIPAISQIVPNMIVSNGACSASRAPEKKMANLSKRQLKSI